MSSYKFDIDSDSEETDCDQRALSTSMLHQRALDYWNQCVYTYIRYDYKLILTRFMSARDVSQSEWLQPSFKPTSKMLQNFANFYVWRFNPRWKRVNEKKRLPTTSTVRTIIKAFYRVYARMTKREIDESIKQKTRNVRF